MTVLSIFADFSNDFPMESPPFNLIIPNIHHDRPTISYFFTEKSSLPQFFYQIPVKNIFLDFFLPIFLPNAFFALPEKNIIPCRPLSTRDCLYWANQIRTGECRSQSPVPYRLAIAHYLYCAFPGYDPKSTIYNKNPCYIV